MVNSILKRLGFQLVRVTVPAKIPYPPTQQERNLIDAAINQFVATVDASDPTIADAAEWKSYLNNSRVSFFSELVKLVTDTECDLSGASVADFGSGTGCLLRVVGQQFPDADLTGIDTFVEANRLAKLICPQANFYSSFDDVDKTFDLIFCTEVLEHLIQPESYLTQLLERLNSGGTLVLTVPEGRSDTCGAGKIRDDKTAYWGHVNFWSPESWATFLEHVCGSERVKKTGQLGTGENFAFVET